MLHQLNMIAEELEDYNLTTFLFPVPYNVSDMESELEDFMANIPSYTIMIQYTRVRVRGRGR